MTPIQYNIIGNDDGAFITVVVPGRAPLVAGPEHPNHDAILEALLNPEDYSDTAELVELFDVAQAVATRFDVLTERVSVNTGVVYFDNDPVDNSLTQQIVRFLDEGVDDWQPLVLFMENVAANPSEQSRTQLFDWLNRRDFAIDEDGHIVAYKGVARTDETADGKAIYRSLHAGPAIVNGEQRERGYVEQQVGDCVELPRSDVAFDPAASCAYGLHVGTYEYAQSYARNGAFLKVTVNPRDVVSVPTADYGDKVRVCRYVIQDVIDDAKNGEVTTALDQADTDDEVCAVCDKPYDRCSSGGGSTSPLDRETWSRRFGS